MGQLTNLQDTPGRRAGARWNEADHRKATAVTEDGDPVGSVDAASGERLGSTTVLVVDDEPILREVLVQTLRLSGYQVLEAADAMEARRLTLTNQKIDLLLTDFRMPDINGLELARWFRANYPETKVLITTGALWELADQLGDQERVAILPKPFDGFQLDRMVRLVLG